MQRSQRTPICPARRSASASSGFSLVEILVVIAIMAILLTMVFKGGPALIKQAKARETEGLLAKLNLALDEYRREANHQNVPNAKNRFNGYPPDDLFVFVGGGADAAGCTVALRNTGELIADGKIGPETQYLQQGDIRAMVLAMRLFSPKATQVLDSIDNKYWGGPDGFAYEPKDGSSPIPLTYLVDAWGNPLEYFSTCICTDRFHQGYSPTPRVKTSNDFVHVNNDGAIIVSYGPNGEEQVSADQLATDSTMVADWYPDGSINHWLNEDNIYSADFFAKRIRQ